MDETYSMVVEINQPDNETDLEAMLEQTEKEFMGIVYRINVKERKLVPLETVLIITLEVAKGIAVTVFIKFLEKLWQEFRKRDLTPQTQGLDAIQLFTERYLLSMGIREMTLLRRDDKGLYVKFVFSDKKGNKHIVAVASFDLKILSYERT
jgi:hypothetical protein